MNLMLLSKYTDLKMNKNPYMIEIINKDQLQFPHRIVHNQVVIKSKNLKIYSKYTNNNKKMKNRFKKCWTIDSNHTY